MHSLNHPKNRRRHFLVDKPLQFRYSFYIAITLFIVCSVSAIGLYFGIWGSVMRSFSDDKIQAVLQTASRLEEYEAARTPAASRAMPPSLKWFKEVSLLSLRQREIMNEILEKANKELLWPLILLIISIGAGSIYLTNKIAGPLYRLRKSFEEIESGNLKLRIHLRRFDEGKQVADEFNKMAVSLDESVQKLKKITRESDVQDLKFKLSSELSKFRTTKE